MDSAPSRRRPAPRAPRVGLRFERLEARETPAVFTVTSAADAGPGSLRQAILDANTTPAADTIRFQIGTGVQVIHPATALPDVTAPAILDATTQPGFAGTPVIVLDGSAAPAGSSGLVLANHTGSTIRGFIIANFSAALTDTGTDAAGIDLRNGGGHTVQGNYVGTDGATAQPNGPVGILVNNSANNLIGGTTAAARNVVAGNRSGGIYIVNPGAVGNRVQGNYVGTDATGTLALTDGTPTDARYQVTLRGAAFNSIGGVVIGGFGPGPGLPAGHNTIGGTDPGAGNVIANELYAVRVVSSTGNSVLGNALRGNAVAILLDSSYHPNDALDADGGANGWQNQPVLTQVTHTGAGTPAAATVVTGTLNAAPNTTFRVELFRGARGDADVWGDGSGQVFVGAVQVTTDATGAGTFTATLPPQPARQLLTATATNLATGDTSQVSRPLAIPEGGAPGIDAGLPAGLRGYAVALSSGEPRVWLYNADGTLKRTFLAYTPAFRGGVHVATADVNGDGVLDVITAPGQGGGPHVRVFDGATGNVLREFMAYAPAFTGGVWVAAGDLNGDGKADIVTGAGPGGGPHVAVFDGATGAPVYGFFPYDPGFRGGVTVAVADVDGDGKADIVTGAGAGGGPHVRVFRGDNGQPLRDFLAYDATSRTGIVVTAGDFDGDGKADVATAPMSGNQPVRVYNFNGMVLREATLGDAGSALGVRLAMRDVDNDGAAEVLAASATGGRTRLVTLKPQGDPIDTVTLDPAALGGVFVG